MSDAPKPGMNGTTVGTAMDLQVGDEFGFGAMDWSNRHDDNIRVEAMELTDDGLVRIWGLLLGGCGRGHRSSWSVQFTQPVEYRRG